MLGDSTSLPSIASTIVCNGPHVFTFLNTSQLHIYLLQITSCGSVTVPAVSVVSVSHVQTLGSVFQNNGKASLLVVGSMLNCSKTSFESSIYITGNIAFLDNSAGTNGGGVYLERSILHLTCNGTMTFAGNIIGGSDISTSVTGTGGGISALYSGVSLEGNSTFRGNVAMGGGELSVLFSQLNCRGYISLVNNYVDGYGSGLLLTISKGKLINRLFYTLTPPPA